MSVDSYELEKYRAYPELVTDLSLDMRSMFCGYKVFQDTFDGETRAFFESWNPEEWPDSPEDILWEIESGYETRPDMISYRFYNTTHFWWLICFVNNLNDPAYGFEPGQVIRIPPFNTITSYIYGRIK
jgi:hypothetical protein